MAHYQNVVAFDPETPQSLHTCRYIVLILSGGWRGGFNIPCEIPWHPDPTSGNTV